MRKLPKIRSALLALGLLLLTACNAAETLPETATPAATPQAATAQTGWMSDAQKEAIGETQGDVWVAAWFAGEQFMPEALTRRWRQVAQPASTPQALLALSVDLLDQPPPPLTSAFKRGLDVRDVFYEDGQVWIDLDAASPGLQGHGSAGLLVGSEQLKQAAAFYFPEAQTLCVAYDGAPTNVEEGGPIFLHDASGCPILLR